MPSPRDDNVPTPLIYDPDTPAEFQTLSWTCSIRTTTWVLKSLGVQTTAGEVYDLMVPTYANEAHGLLDSSGAGIVQVLADNFRLPAANREGMSWEDLTAWASEGPVALGGEGWGPAGHWVAVRRVRKDGSLALANPAEGGYLGVNEQMSRSQFDELGPFSAVRITQEVWWRYRVVDPGGRGVALRVAPDSTARILKSLSAGAVVAAGGQAWRKVRDTDGTTGWVAADLLAPA